jgi:hypothetical protein
MPQKTITTDRPLFLNDVVPPLMLFKVFLDKLLANNTGEPLTEDEYACLEGGACALAQAIADMRTLGHYIDELEMKVGGQR